MSWTAIDFSTPSEGPAEGRVASHTDASESKRSKTRLANAEAERNWSNFDQPSWLTAEFYRENIQPQLIALSSHAIARHICVSRGYATDVRRGREPHPRHWQNLARLVGLCSDSRGPEAG